MVPGERVLPTPIHPTHPLARLGAAPGAVPGRLEHARSLAPDSISSIAPV